jgi:signal transduction histidine kinase
MVRPIRTLDEGARRIAAGDLDQKIEVQTSDELEALANQFNRMTETLRESYAGLEQKVEERTKALNTSLQQQTAITEILRVIANSPTDVQPVLEAIAERAALLCNAAAASMYLTDGRVLRHLASKGPSADPVNRIEEVPIDRAVISGRALLERRTIVIDDMLKAEAEFPISAEFLRRSGTRAIVVAPLFGEGEPFGTILLRRHEPHPFTERELALLQIFGDQAAIALKNVRLFEEIQEKSRQVEIASQHKMQFLANMSHELRTPLNAILGYAELLADGIYGPLEDRVRGVLERVQHNGKHLLGLINDVLDLSKIDANQLKLSLDAYSMSGVVKSTVASTESLARNKGLALEAVIAEPMPTGWGDERRLTQVLLNIVGNAIRFTDHGKVEIAARAEDGQYVLEVRDTGPGIAEADQARIFEEFQQVDLSSTRAKGGTGLGLAIAKRIVEMHGGTIGVDSKLGTGSTFRIVLPIRVEQQKEAA